MARAVAEAEASLGVGETQLAESRYRSALFEGWLLLGRIDEQTGELEQARRAYEAASTAQVAVRRARIALSLVLVELGEIDQAELVLRTLIADDPSDHEARRLLSTAFARSGRLDEAVQELEQLRYLTPDDPENAYLLATAYLKQSRLDEADQLLDELAARLPTAQTWILIGRTYRDADRFERARRSFDEALSLDPEVRRAHYYLGTVDLLEAGASALADAANEFQAELRLTPDEPMTSLYLGMALVEDRRFEEAIAPLATASRRDDVRADALRFQGRALLEVDRVGDAIEALQRGLDAANASLSPNEDPTEFQARQLSGLHYQLAQALRRAGDSEAANVHFDEAKRFQAASAESARESLDRYLESETSDPALGGTPPRPVAEGDRDQLVALRDDVETSLARIYLNLGILRARDNQHARATHLFEQAARLEPTLPGLQYSLGVALFNSASYPGAARALSSALEQGSAPVGPATEMLALAWLNAERPAKAAELLAGIPEASTTPGLRYARGLALVRSGRAEEASPIFERLLRDNADWPELNVLLGQASAQQGDFEGAIAALRHALELDPEVAEAHGTLAEIHLRRGELGPAEAELREELRHHPEDARSRYTLATVLDLNQKQDEATELLRELLAEQPESAKARYLLGKVLLTQGEAEAAREQLEAAAGLQPDDPETHYQLGQAYQKLGRRDDARKEFEAFRRLKDRARDGEGS